MKVIEFDDALDCYRSWEEYIKLCRERLVSTGQYPPSGPWQKPSQRPSPGFQLLACEECGLAFMRNEAAVQNGSVTCPAGHSVFWDDEGI